MARLIFMAIIAISGTVAWAQSSDLALPDIGASADTLISPEQERRIGVSMMREFRAHNLVLDDPLFSDYLNGLGYRLVAQSERQAGDFTFFTVRTPDINAFAAPGGFIGVNTGLIHTADNESELAAVIGHEIAHVSQRHLVRAVESMQKVSLPILLGMLAAAIAAQSAGNGDGTQAALIGGLGLMQQKSITFTRNNEYEADRVGIQTLHRAGYDPDAMANFFARMARAVRGTAEEGSEFLRTHPVTVSRVTEAKNRAEAMRALEKPVIDQNALDDRRFLLMRERAWVLSSDHAQAQIPYYQGRLVLASDRERESLRYGLGLAQLASGKSDAARDTLGQLTRADPGNPLFELPLAEAERGAGHLDAALDRTQRLVRHYPGNRAVTLAYAAMLNATETRANGAKAADLLRGLIFAGDEDLAAQRAFARASELAGQELRALEAHAEVALLSGRPLDAMEQLQRLLKRPNLDYYQRARVEALVALITPYILEVERERRREPPQP